MCTYCCSHCEEDWNSGQCKGGLVSKKKKEELFGIVNQKGTAQGGRTISERASDQYWAFRRSFERDENGEYKLLQIEHLCA